MRLLFKTCSKLVRICVIAGSVTLTGWTALAAPEPWERRALSLPDGRLDWSDRRALREMRVLRLANSVAPGLMIDLISHGAPEVPRAVIAQALDDAAHGRPLNDTMPPQQPQRGMTGAKFQRPPG